MGDHADDYNGFQADSIDDLGAWEAGQLSMEEATERGVLDETTGEVWGDTTAWGVHDVESLVHEIDRCEAILRIHSLERQRRSDLYWVSQGRLYKPQDMTTSHLRNAIIFADRTGIKSPVVSMMREEYARRQV